MHSIGLRHQDIPCGRYTWRKYHNESNDDIQRETYGEHHKILIDIAIIYYIAEFKHSEGSALRNAAVTNI
jgi:hypothetical protein